MSKELYPLILKATLVYEGGFSNNPADPGGATMKGVTQRVYDNYRKRKNLTTQSVSAISDAELQDIYRAQYWSAVKGDELPAGVDFVVFDGGVMSGPSQSIKWLQRALLDLNLYRGPVDGICGNGTLAAANAAGDDDRLVDLICDRRLAFCKSLKTWKTFGKGWGSRIANARAKGKAWATGGVGPAAALPIGNPQKAVIEDAKPLPTKAPGDALLAAGPTVGGGGGFGLDQIRDQLTPYAGSLPWVNNIIVGLIVTGAAMTACGLAYRWYATRTAKKRADALDLPSGVTA